MDGAEVTDRLAGFCLTCLCLLLPQLVPHWRAADGVTTGLLHVPDLLVQRLFIMMDIVTAQYRCLG